METKANYALVGGFAVITVIMAFVLLAVLTSFFKHTGKESLNVYIEGSAAGLTPSSLVLFNGVSVGVVTDLRIDPKKPNIAIVSCVVNKNTPITASTRAILVAQGVTGGAQLELMGGNLNEPKLLEIAKTQHKVAAITAQSASLDNMIITAQDVATNVKLAVADIHEVVKDLKKPLIGVISNANIIIEALAKNEDLAKEGSEIIKNLNQVTTKMNVLISGFNQLLDGPNKNGLIHKIQDTATSIQKTAQTLNTHIGPIAQNLETLSGRSAKDFEALFYSLNRSINRIEHAVSELEKDPSRIVWGGEDKSMPTYDGNRG